MAKPAKAANTSDCNVSEGANPRNRASPQQGRRGKAARSAHRGQAQAMPRRRPERARRAGESGFVILDLRFTTIYDFRFDKIFRFWMRGWQSYGKKGIIKKVCGAGRISCLNGARVWFGSCFLGEIWQCH